MDEATRERVAAMLGKSVTDLTIGEIIWLVLTLDDGDGEDALREMVGLPPQ